MSTIAADTRIRRKPNLLDAEVQGEIVSLDVAGGDCYGFNSVASRVWTELENETTIEDICLALLEEFDVSQIDCREAVTNLINRLHNDGLVIAA